MAGTTWPSVAAEGLAASDLMAAERGLGRPPAEIAAPSLCSLTPDGWGGVGARWPLGPASHPPWSLGLPAGAPVDSEGPRAPRSLGWRGITPRASSLSPHLISVFVAVS